MKYQNSIAVLAASVGLLTSCGGGPRTESTNEQDPASNPSGLYVISEGHAAHIQLGESFFGADDSVLANTASLVDIRTDQGAREIACSAFVASTKRVEHGLTPPADSHIVNIIGIEDKTDLIEMVPTAGGAGVYELSVYDAPTASSGGRVTRSLNVNVLGYLGLSFTVSTGGAVVRSGSPGGVSHPLEGPLFANYPLLEMGNNLGSLYQPVSAMTTPQGDCVTTACEFLDGSTITFTANPDPGYVLTSVSGTNCDAMVTGNTIQVTVSGTAPNNCSVQFEDATQVTPIELNQTGDGRVAFGPAGQEQMCTSAQCIRNYRIGETIVFNAQPAHAQAEVRWSGDCSANSPTSATLVAGMASTCTVEFVGATGPRLDLRVPKAEYGAVAVTVDGSAGETCPGNNEVMCTYFGNEIRLDAQARATGRFLKWSGDCASYGSQAQITISMSTQNPMNCVAEFEAEEITCSMVNDPTFSIRRSRSATYADMGGVVVIPSGERRIYLYSSGDLTVGNASYRMNVYSNDEVDFLVSNDEVRLNSYLSSAANPASIGGDGYFELTVTDDCGARTTRLNYSVQ